MGLVGEWEGSDVSRWREEWRLPALECHDVLGSTSDRLKELARSGAAPWTLVLAEEQTAGRGRRGTEWVSRNGSGIWMSVLLPLVEGSAVPGGLSLLVGLAVAEAVEEVLPGLPVGIKWPNDLFLRGRKVAGVLCEAEKGGVVAGVGLNVHQRTEEFPPDLVEIATSLALASASPLAPRVRARLVGAILGRLRAHADPPPGFLRPDEVEGLNRRDVLRGRRVSSEMGESGVAEGIAPDGSLIVRSPHGPVAQVAAGRVTLVDTA
ncbi:MAG: biotin--[acetyl-CoA-carboxylase] ligase [Gemmatimonadota bacterium]|nr:biotin--[acetyl-CoA-carboxylase] ligase [Gemmatimonadota bacterium]